MSLRAVPVLLVLLAGLGFAQSGARYLIITHDNFYDAVKPLADWKTKKGMLCVVKRTSEIGSQNTQIRSYIINAWSTWEPRPEFVLLVGSPSLIPAFSHGWQHNRIYSDNRYGDVTGDSMADLPYGRLPCKTARQCSTMVNKILLYERYPYVADTLWFRRATGVLRDAGDSDAYTYWSDLRYVAGLLTGAGTTAVESISSSRGQNLTHVVSAVDNGTGFVLYRGTATVNWYTPFNVDPSVTNNGKRLPIICSFTCETVTLSSYDTMIGDAWLKVGTPTVAQGAVAFIGNTHSASNVAAKRSAMTRGFFSGLVSDSLLTLGEAMLRGKRQVYGEFRDWIEYFGFNLLGDPELNVWTTTPAALSVEYDSVVPTEPFPFLVTVRQQDRPVPGALVCVQSAALGIYDHGYTDGNGLVLFALDPGASGAIQVTVTARNCRPHEGSCRVDPLSAVRESEPVPRIRQLRVCPNPGRARVRFEARAGSSIAVYSSSGRRVSSEMSVPTGACLDWDPSALPAGLYLVRSRVPDGRMSAEVLQIVR
jgi:hypothetical protein